jgi:hypothetical protein
MMTMRRLILLVLLFLVATMTSPALAQDSRPSDVVADFNNDGFADLTAGAPWEGVASLIQAGAVSVLYGSAGGLTTAGGRLFTQVGGTVEIGDHFGSELAAGDLNDDGFAELAAAAPSENLGLVMWAGAVSVLDGSAGGLGGSGGGCSPRTARGSPTPPRSSIASAGPTSSPGEDRPRPTGPPGRPGRWPRSGEKMQPGRAVHVTYFCDN